LEKRKFNFFFISIPLPFFLKKEIGKGKKTEKKREKEKKEGNKESGWLLRVENAE
jgi:hypothetical protein